MVWLEVIDSSCLVCASGIEACSFPLFFKLYKSETKDTEIFYFRNFFFQSKIEFLLQKNYETNPLRIFDSNDLHSQHCRYIHMPLNNYHHCVLYLFWMNSLDLTFHSARIQKILVIFNCSFCKNTN